jgi:type IX secretion system PorP/SprF family membrane protein
MHASFHVPLEGGIAFGASAFNVSQGLLTTSAGKVSAGYLVNIDRTHFLRFGLSVGAGVNSVNITEFDSPDDVAFVDFLDQNSFLIGDFGMTYHFGHFNLGFSIPNLFSYDVVTQSEFAPIHVTPLDNVLIKTNYRGHISKDFAIEPHLIYRYSNVVPHQFEGTVIAHLKHVVWVGASYRQDAGIIGLVGAKVKEKIGFGFAYELGNSKISSELGPTIEFNIGYHLGTKKEHVEHISSFIKSHQHSAEERARLAALERQKQIAALQNSRPTPSSPPTDSDALGIVGTTPKPPLSDPAPTTDTATEQEGDTEDWDHQEHKGTLERTNQFGEQEVGIHLEKPNEAGGKDVVLSWIPSTQAGTLTVAPDGHLERELSDGTKEIGVKYERVNQDGTKENIVKWDKVINEQQAQTIVSNPDLTEAEHEEVAKGDPTLTQDFRTHDDLAASTEPMIVRQGNHLLELPQGNFLFERGFHDALVGYSSARGYYYVVVFRSGDITRTRARRDEMRKLPILSNAWVLQVTE